MVILDPSLEERTIAPSLEKYLNVVTKDGGSVESVDVWGRRRLSYEIKKNAEAIYAVITLNAEPATVSPWQEGLRPAGRRRRCPPPSAIGDLRRGTGQATSATR